MRAGGRGSSAGRERFTLLRMLIATQVALSMVLLVGALLFVRSLRNLVTPDPGFRPEVVVVVDLNLDQEHYSKEATATVRRDLLQSTGISMLVGCAQDHARRSAILK